MPAIFNNRHFDNISAPPGNETSDQEAANDLEPGAMNGAVEKNRQGPVMYTGPCRSMTTRTLFVCPSCGALTNYRVNHCAPAPCVGCTIPGPPNSETGTGVTAVTRPRPSSTTLTTWPTKPGSVPR